jgi:hypothetical protein
MAADRRIPARSAGWHLIGQMLWAWRSHWGGLARLMIPIALFNQVFRKSARGGT